MLIWELSTIHVGEKNFLRSFISSLRGECSFPTWGFANPYVGIVSSLPWDRFVPPWGF